MQKSTCAKFKAVENQNSQKQQGKDLTGMFTILCNHGVPEPMGSVDLQRGERYDARTIQNIAFTEGD